MMTPAACVGHRCPSWSNFSMVKTKTDGNADKDDGNEDEDNEDDDRWR